jgi:SNF2 family DNA or RNA helicase
VFIEREWVSGWEEQAEARVNRIGATTDTCWAIYLTVEGTVDQHFDRVIESKRAVLKAITDGGEEVDRVNVIEEILTSMAESATGKDKVQLESMLHDYKNGDKNNDKGAKKYE